MMFKDPGELVSCDKGVISQAVMGVIQACCKKKTILITHHIRWSIEICFLLEVQIAETVSYRQNCCSSAVSAQGEHSMMAETSEIIKTKNSE